MFISILAILAAALPMSIAAAATLAASQSASVDRAYDLLGTWNCANAAGSSATMTFIRQSEGSFTMRNFFNAPHGAQGEFDETYRLVSPAQYWLWTATWPAQSRFQRSCDRRDMDRARTGSSMEP